MENNGNGRKVATVFDKKDTFSFSIVMKKVRRENFWKKLKKLSTHDKNSDIVFLVEEISC